MCINKQQMLIIRGKECNIDNCLVPIIDALNKGGVPTIASCCGHGNRWGNIMLADDRELIIAPDFESARAFDKVHGRSICDVRRTLLKKELAATDSQQLKQAIALLHRWQGPERQDSHEAQIKLEVESSQLMKSVAQRACV
jgi:hypothetical protein